MSMHVNTKLDLISKFTVFFLAMSLVGCFLDTKIVGLQEQSKNLSNPSESPTPSEIDFSIHDKPGSVSLQKIKLNSDITNSAASINSPNLEFSIKFVDISGANDVKLVKVPFDGSAPTYWNLPFLI